MNRYYGGIYDKDLDKWELDKMARDKLFKKANKSLDDEISSLRNEISRLSQEVETIEADIESARKDLLQTNNDEETIHLRIEISTLTGQLIDTEGDIAFAKSSLDTATAKQMKLLKRIGQNLTLEHGETMTYDDDDDYDYDYDSEGEIHSSEPTYESAEIVGIYPEYVVRQDEPGSLFRYNDDDRMG